MTVSIVFFSFPLLLFLHHNDHKSQVWFDSDFDYNCVLCYFCRLKLNLRRWCSIYIITSQNLKKKKIVSFLKTGLVDKWMSRWIHMHVFFSSLKCIARDKTTTTSSTQKPPPPNTIRQRMCTQVPGRALAGSDGLMVLGHTARSEMSNTREDFQSLWSHIFYVFCWALHIQQ